MEEDKWPARTPSPQRGEENMPQDNDGSGDDEGGASNDEDDKVTQVKARDSTAINADYEDPIDPKMPHMPPA